MTRYFNVELPEYVLPGGVQLFEQLEPFFINIFGEKRKYTLTEKAQWFNLVNSFNDPVKMINYESIISLLDIRTAHEFDKSVEYLKQFPLDEHFKNHVETELQRYDFAKEMILFLFNISTDSMSNGHSCNIYSYVKDIWNRNYITKVNSAFGLSL